MYDSEKKIQADNMAASTEAWTLVPNITSSICYANSQQTCKYDYYNIIQTRQYMTSWYLSIILLITLKYIRLLITIIDNKYMINTYHVRLIIHGEIYNISSLVHNYTNSVDGWTNAISTQYLNSIH